MFLIPISTDAPIYHWPWVTLSLIITNTITLVITSVVPEMADDWQLGYGRGLHPLEWISCNFVHFGFFHLLGNMLFLWGFGIVVEGKLGWWRYLLVYFGIGVVRAFIEQWIMIDYRGDYSGSGGASGVIFGLMAMTLVWAPRNEITFLFIFFFRGVLFDAPILVFSVGYFALQVIIASIFRFEMSTPVIHLLGVGCGFVLASAMLKLRWVDCENWDLFAVLRGTHGRQTDDELGRYHGADPKSRRRSANIDLPGDEDSSDDEFARAQKAIVRKTKSIRKMRALLAQKKPVAALAEYERLQHVLSGCPLDAADLKALAGGLYKGRSFAKAIPLMEEFIDRFPEAAGLMRLKLAGVLIEVQQRPRYALRVLEEESPGSVSAKHKGQAQRMKQAAQQMIDEGVVELDGHAW